MTSPKIVATVLCRLDQWSLRLALRSALEWCDEVVVGIHEPGGAVYDPCWMVIADLSKDPALAQRIDVVALGDESWDEMDMRQRLLLRARELGATHIAIVDADEAVTADLVPTIRDHVTALRPKQALDLRMVSPHHGQSKTGASLDVARCDGIFGRANITLAFGDDPSLAWKNAEDGYCYHNRPPRGLTDRAYLASNDTSGVFHLQYASLLRLASKAAYYKIIERMKFPDRDASQPAALNDKYDWTLNDDGERYTPIPDSRWAYAFGDGRAFVDLTEVPWQAYAVRALTSRLDPSVTAGLELHEWAWGPVTTPDVLPPYYDHL